MIQRKTIAGITTISLLVCLLSIGQSLAQSKTTKKVINWGTDTQDTRYIRDHWQEIEQLPLDGIAFKIALDRTKPTTGDGCTANILGWHLWGTKPFRLQDFQPALDDLKDVKWNKLTSNFLVATICSNGQDYGFDWFDDKRWNTVLNNWKIYVTLAKESGCKGIIIDTEQYAGVSFYYQEMNQRHPGSFDSHAAKVRQRGRQLMKVTSKIYPDITLPIVFSHNWIVYEMSNRSVTLPKAYNSLLPAFIDGMLEGSDKRTKFIDFNEGAYGATDRQLFLEWYHSTYNKGLQLSMVPDRYRDQMSAGFPVFIDFPGPLNDKPWDTNDLNKNFYTPDSLKTVLRSALDVSDEYVWIYYDRVKGASFFPPSNLPQAYLDAIREAKQ